jgi:hypothetical protein
LIAQRNRERVGKSLSGPQRRAVLGDEDADLPLLEVDLLVPSVDVVDDVDEQARMEAGREDLGLRTILAVGRDDATCAERPSSVDPEQMSDMPVGDLHERRREYAEADDNEPHRAKCILDKPVSVLSRNQRRSQKQDDGACGHPEDQTQHVALLGKRPHSCELALITRVAVPNAEVFIAGANFEDSAIFKLWGEDGIEFEPDPEFGKGLRYSRHPNGELVTIYYVTEQQWSRKRREAAVGDDGARVQDRMIQAAKEVFPSGRFLWHANTAKGSSGNNRFARLV